MLKLKPKSNITPNKIIKMKTFDIEHIVNCWQLILEDNGIKYQVKSYQHWIPSSSKILAEFDKSPKQFKKAKEYYHSVNLEGKL
jgi:hypothetical protein